MYLSECSGEHSADHVYYSWEASLGADALGNAD
jgi:hypothetical protein